MLSLRLNRDSEIIIHQEGKVLCRIILGGEMQYTQLAFLAEKAISIDRVEIFMRKYPEVELPPFSS